MKKIALFIMGAVMTLSLCACACNNTAPATTPTTTAPTTRPTTVPTTAPPTMPTETFTVPIPETNIPDPSVDTSLPEGTMNDTTGNEATNGVRRRSIH